MKKKKLTIAVILIIVIIIGVCVIVLANKNQNQESTNNIHYNEEQNYGEEQLQETNEIEETPTQVTGKAVEGQTIKDYQISNVTMTAKQSQTEVRLTIKNISSKETVERDVYLKYFDNQNSEIGRTRIHLPKMQKNKEIELSTIITKDLKNATNYTIEY